MKHELDHILFEIDEHFIELLQFTTWHFKLKSFNEDWDVSKEKEKFIYNANQLLSYIRALRDILENG